MTFYLILRRKSVMVACQALFLAPKLNQHSVDPFILPLFWCPCSLRPQGPQIKSVCVRTYPKAPKVSLPSILISSKHPFPPILTLRLAWQILYIILSFAIHNSQFSIHNSQFTIHNSHQFSILNSDSDFLFSDCTCSPRHASMHLQYCKVPSHLPSAP